MDFTIWDYVKTVHHCTTCGFPLYRVHPSTMVVCANPVCPSDPHYLVGADE